MTRPHAHDRPTTIVVGAGIGGLATAVLLAEAGHEVTVFDGSGAAGGRARTTVGPEGHHRNLGPHALYLDGTAHDVLRRVGVDPAGSAPPIPATRLMFGGRLRRLLGPACAPSALRIVRAWKAIDATSVEAQTTSIAAWAEASLPRPRDWAIAHALGRLSTYSADLDRVPVGVAAAANQGPGVRYVDGGWQSIVEALLDRARVTGVTVRLGQPVDRVVVEDGRVRGVALRRGAVESAEQVVLAGGGPRVAADLTADIGVLEVDRAKWLQATPIRAACLDLALGAGARGRPIVIGVDRADYLSDHGRVAELAPKGGTVVHAARYLRSDEQGDDRVRAELHELLDLAWTGWRDHVIDDGFRPGLVVSHDLADVARGGWHGRPAPIVDAVDGLALVGDWVGARGHLLDAVLASAQDAVSGLLRASDGIGAAA